MNVETFREAYRNPGMRKLLMYLVERGSLQPYISSGVVRYLDAERISGESPSDLSNALVRLAADGLLKKAINSELACPDCYKIDLGIKLSCSKCKSDNIVDRRLLRHRGACQAIKEEEGFYADVDKKLCSKCKKPVNNKELEVIQQTRVCLGCNEKAPHSTLAYFSFFASFCRDDTCPSKGKLYGLSELRGVEVSSYHPSEELRRELEFLVPVQKVFLRHEYEVYPYEALSGRSGVLHTYTIVARKGSKTVVLEHMPSDREIAGPDALNIRGKNIDTKVELCYVFVSNKLTEDVTKIIKGFNLTLVSSFDELDNALSKLDNVTEKSTIQPS